MEKVVNMDSKPSFVRSPIVYTTRLEDMKVLSKDLNNISTKDIVQSIICESKPQYIKTNSIDNAKYKTRNNINKQYKGFRREHQGEVNFEITSNNTSKHEDNRSKPNSSENEVVIKSKNERDIHVSTGNKLETYLALCKPLKIVLQDINKVKPKINDEIKTELLSISSDSDDSIAIVDENIIIDISDANKTCAIGKTLTNPSLNHIIKNIDDFKNILTIEDLFDSVLVFFNLYVKELDAYQIGECYTVTQYKTRKCTEVYKFPMKKCKLVINIITCCWKNRQSYISVLLNYQKYIEIARFINIRHSCKKVCTCCCVSMDHCSQAPDAINISGENNIIVTDSLLNNSYALNKSSSLISVASKFEKNTKWKGYSDMEGDDSCCTYFERSLQFSHSRVKEEFYEFGRKNVIYSKVVNKIDDKSSWLFKTLNHSRKHTKFSYTDPVDLEKKIITFRHVMNIISFNTECFLRTPLSIEVLKKTNRPADKEKSKRYVIEHKRSFMGGNNKKSKVLSIVSEIRKTKVQPSALPLSTRQFSADTQPAPEKLQSPLKPTQPIDPNVSQTINCLIKDMLHRFRNVLLTINADGKVAAALNAPLNSLTPNELKILAQILTHAQSQVATLGLTPGTCLNPDAPMAIKSRGENLTSTDTASLSSDLTYSAKSDVHKSLPRNEQGVVGFKKNHLFLFSKGIGDKKLDYKISFFSFLGETLEETPKITNVFSLNSGNFNSDILDNSKEESNVMIATDDSSVVTEILNTNTVPSFYKKEMNEVTIADNKTKSVAKKRKCYTYSKRNCKKPQVSQD